MWWKNKYLMILAAFLVVQGAGFHTINLRGEYVPRIQPLRVLPHELGTWRMLQESEIDAETKDVLRADDTLVRVYQDQSTGMAASLYVAFFKSQRSGVMPHSPKNCLPGNGWVPMSVGRVQLNAPPRREPFEANLYVVQRGENKTVVLYWYQSRDRIVASEYTARVFLVADSLRYNRSDTTLVRAMMPFQGDDAGPASEGLRRFVEAFFGPLQAILPS